ncbi:MAG: DUF1579 family protein, partial [Candidatus Omnitrophica bacterium]|nr:DUF1579 family protein [Candidatus Omnitrophota bacterium]
MSKFNLNLFILAFLVMTTVSGYAQDAAPTVEGTAMSQEEMAMQKQMMEYSTVNENHAVLNSLAGSWNTHASFWMDPKGPAQESDGTSQNAIIMGGRFLEQKFSGSMMGQPFEGRGIFGYDNFRKEYTGIWFDNFATGMMVSASQYNTTTKTFI